MKDTYQSSVYGFSTTLRARVSLQLPKYKTRLTVDVSAETPESTARKLHVDLPPSSFLKAQVVEEVFPKYQYVGVVLPGGSIRVHGLLCRSSQA